MDKSHPGLFNYLYRSRKIRALRESSDCRGITWGVSKGKTNSLRGSHVIILGEKEVVVLSCGKSRSDIVNFFQYKRTRTTSLGRNIRLVLRINKKLKADINEVGLLPGMKIIRKNSGGFGRTHGLTRGSDKLSGSHLTFINPDELVIVRQERNTNNLFILQYKKATETLLGIIVREILTEKDIPFREPLV